MGSTVQIVEVAPGGGEGGSVDAASSLAVWDVTGNKVLHVLQSPGVSQVRGLCISADGRRAAAGLDEGVAVWELESGQRSADCSGHSGAVLAAAFSFDGRWLVTGGQDYSARRWRLPE
jgi:WD40 repeat protein